MTRPFLKVPLALEAQLNRLIQRGLKVADRPAAVQTLRRVNYYRLSGYWRIFRQNDETFRAEGSFESAVARYEFDRRLRLICLDMIERVEVAMRCQIAYQLAIDSGAFAHEDPQNFVSTHTHESWRKRLHKETKRSKEVFVQHFKDTYAGFPALPVWVACEIMSFGALSTLFKGLKSMHRQAVAQPYGIPHKVLGSWLHALTYVRNTCAHHGRLWNRELPIRPKRPFNHPNWRTDVAPERNRVYAVLCVLRHLSMDDPASDEWARRVVALLSELDPTPKFRSMAGVPVDWADSAFWTGLR